MYTNCPAKPCPGQFTGPVGQVTFSEINMPQQYMYVQTANILIQFCLAGQVIQRYCGGLHVHVCIKNIICGSLHAINCNKATCISLPT